MNMKKIVVFIAGFTPFIIGYYLNQIILNTKYGNSTFYFITSCSFFLYWGLLGFIFCKLKDSKIYTTIICNLPAFSVLLVLLYQELVIKQYWSNYWSRATQYFYLPTMKISFDLTPYFHNMWESYIVSFVLMAIAFYFGCYIRGKVDLRRTHNWIAIVTKG